VNPLKYKVGMLVKHPQRQEWGPGRILEVHGRTLTIYFRDAREDKAGEAVKRINLDHATLEVPDEQSDPWLDSLPPIKDGKLDLPRPRWTLTQAIEHFMREFPLGFDDPSYLGDRNTGERQYKWHAHELFVSLLGTGEGNRLLNVGEIQAVTKRALTVIGSVNLLAPQEQMALRDGLRNSNAATEFFRSLFDLLAAAGPEKELFEAYISALNSLPAEEGRARVATWPVLTVLPFLANPQCFMFLKPEVTKRAADTLAFNLQYDSKLNWITYESLLRMSRILMDHLRPLGARDWIDVQSFIWVTERIASGERHR
jgi:hypothetical protein